MKIYGYCHGKGNNFKIINPFIQSCNGELISYKQHVDNQIVQHPKNGILVFRSRGKWATDIIKECWKTKQHFIFIETGYFLHKPKIYHRMTVDHYQKYNITERPDDRWKTMQAMGAAMQPWQKNGKKIIVALPSNTSINAYNFTVDEWTEKTVKILKENTDREIIIRGKPTLPDRRAGNTMDRLLAGGEVHALVTFQSGSSIEAVFAGVPVFVDKHIRFSVLYPYCG